MTPTNTPERCYMSACAAIPRLTDESAFVEVGDYDDAEQEFVGGEYAGVIYCCENGHQLVIAKG